MPRQNYKTKDARRRHSPFAPAELTEYEILMTNEAGDKVKYVKVQGTSGVNAWWRATRENEGWTPVEITRGNEWKYTAF